MSSILIQNALIAGETTPVDLLIEDGIIVRKALAGSIDTSSVDQVTDANDKIILPGLFDLHAHVCQPGYEARERIATASAAALHGGITGLMAMPDTNPVLDNAAQISTFNELCRHDSIVEIIPTGCLTKGCMGEEQASYDSMRAKGVRIITDGDKTPENMLLLYRAMQYTSSLGMIFGLRGDVPSLTAKSLMHPSTTSYQLGLSGSPACAEEIGTETIIRLSQETGNALHVQTVSTGGSVEILRRFKNEASGLSSEVALHHLIFTHENVGQYDTNFKTLPPLRDTSDNEALIAGVNDGTIDCIVSDHTPCTPFSKKQDFLDAPHGMTGLDTFLPAIYHYLVKPAKMTWETVVKSCSSNPRRLLGLQPISFEVGSVANFVVFDPNGESNVSNDFLRSRSKNTPFLGATLDGKVDVVCLSGQLHSF